MCKKWILWAQEVTKGSEVRTGWSREKSTCRLLWWYPSWLWDSGIRDFHSHSPRHKHLDRAAGTWQVTISRGSCGQAVCAAHSARQRSSCSGVAVGPPQTRQPQHLPVVSIAAGWCHALGLCSISSSHRETAVTALLIARMHGAGLPKVNSQTPGALSFASSPITSKQRMQVCLAPCWSCQSRWPVM